MKVHIQNCKKVLLAGVFLSIGVAARGQSEAPAKLASNCCDVAIMYSAMHSPSTVGGDFWSQGGSVQIHGKFWKGLGEVADVTVEHNRDIQKSGVGLDLVTVTFGPRYTWALPQRRLSIFGQSLLGEARGFNSAFPISDDNITSDANGLALQVGGGVNVEVSRRFALRIIDAAWLHTQLPNSFSGHQNSLKIASGLVVHF